MKKVYLLPFTLLMQSLLCIFLTSSTPPIWQRLSPEIIEKLIIIDLEVNFLQHQLEELERNVTNSTREEMKKEMRSQMKMRSYEWEAFVQQLQAAEEHEESARREELKIRAIKARLMALNAEIQQLLPE